MSAPGRAPRWYEDGALHFGLGIEDTFVPQGGPGERPIDEYELTDHYARYAEDLGLASDAGATFLRWGVPWHRVNPGRGTWDWSWVDRVVDRFDELGLRPVVDLLHYGTPLWLDGQFAHPDYPQVVAEYGVAFAERYGDRVTDYTPVNEPMIHALFSGEYAYGSVHAAYDVAPDGRHFVMIRRYADAVTRFSDGPVERPPYWGGFRIAPETFEFWQGRQGRLHDRFRYRWIATRSTWSASKSDALSVRQSAITARPSSGVPPRTGWPTISTDVGTSVPLRSGAGWEHSVHPSPSRPSAPGNASGASGMPIRGPLGTPASESLETLTVFAFSPIARSAEV